MRKVVIKLLFVLAALIPLAGVYVLNNASLVTEWFTDTGGIKQGEMIPLVSGEEVDGGQVDMKQYKGKKFIAMIAKIDCESCKSSYPTIKKWNELYPDIPLVMVGVGGKEEYSRVKHELQFSFPILSADQSMQNQFLMKITPVFYAVDEEGRVIERMNGYRVRDFKKFMEKAERI